MAARPLAPNERDAFLDLILPRCEGRVGPMRDAVRALMTHADCTLMAQRRALSVELLLAERNAARAKLLALLGES
jgi:hypothetical protein